MSAELPAGADQGVPAAAYGYILKRSARHPELTLYMVQGVENLSLANSMDLPLGVAFDR